MQRSAILVLSTSGLLVLAGCGNDSLPASMVGSYVRSDMAPVVPIPQRMRLELTPSGLTVSSPSVSPAPAGSAIAAPARVAPSGAALFEKVSCKDDTTCKFTTKNACEGTFTHDSTGTVVIVATGECESWSGKWIPVKESDLQPSAVVSGVPSAEPSAVPSADPAAPRPTAVATATATAVPTATGTASTTATATASTTGLPTAAPLNVTCLSKCNDASLACIRQCKVGDIDCMKACSTGMSDCAQKCP